jgi:hypothetical protein
MSPRGVIATPYGFYARRRFSCQAAEGPCLLRDVALPDIGASLAVRKTEETDGAVGFSEIRLMGFAQPLTIAAVVLPIANRGSWGRMHHGQSA